MRGSASRRADAAAPRHRPWSRRRRRLDHHDIRPPVLLPALVRCIGATGSVSAFPSPLTRPGSDSFAVMMRAAVSARALESSQLDGKRAVRIGWLSVWPSTRTLPGSSCNALPMRSSSGSEGRVERGFPGAEHVAVGDAHRDGLRVLQDRHQALLDLGRQEGPQPHRVAARRGWRRRGRRGGRGPNDGSRAGRRQPGQPRERPVRGGCPAAG